MTLTNVPVAVGVWTQVYDGTAASTIAVASLEICQVCQSTSAPDNSTVGLPLIGGAAYNSIFNGVIGTPVYVKPMNKDTVIIVNA